MFYKYFSILIIALVSFASSTIAQSKEVDHLENEELRILRITPDGLDVPVGRQIVIQFNRPVVSIGDMKRKRDELPIKITPFLNCQWQWLNSSALACNLDEKDQFNAATAYELIVTPGIKAVDGATIKEKLTHKFITQRPVLNYTRIKKWLSPTKPAMILQFNQPVTQDSVKSSLTITTFDVDSTEAQDHLFNVKADPDEKEELSYALLSKKEEARRYWLITPQEDLLLDSTVVLRVKPGLVSAAGTEVGVEDREIKSFQTFPEFKFIGIKCISNEEKNVLFEVGKTALGLCDPLKSVSLVFSSPVLHDQVENNITFSPQINSINSWRDFSNLSRTHERGDTYDVDLLYGIKAATEYEVKSRVFSNNIWQKSLAWIKGKHRASTNILDGFGRPLINDININFKTDHRKPNFKIGYRNVVLESKSDSEVPLYTNNLDSITFDYRKITVQGSEDNLLSVQKIPKVDDIQFAVPLNVRKMLNGKSGAVYGHFSTKPMTVKMEDEHLLFAQVTPYQLHVKLGHFNTLVWVTDMATGKPVENAKVSIYVDKITELGSSQQVLSQSLTGSNGTAILGGTKEIDPDLNLLRNYKHEDDYLFIRVDKDDELAIMPLNNDFLLDSYRTIGEGMYHSSKKQHGYIRAWGTTAQGIYRAGDNIKYKFYVRDVDNQTLISAAVNKYNLEVIDPIGNKVHEVKEIDLNEFGAYAGEFTVSKQGAIGWYRFCLETNLDSEGSVELENRYIGCPIKVLISDFTTAPFKVTNQVNGNLFQAGQEIEVTSQAKLHSGGPYIDADVRVTALLQNQAFVSKNTVFKDFTFDSHAQDHEQNQIFQKIDRLSNLGEDKLIVKLPRQNIYYGRMMIESAVADDRGKYIAAQTYADYASIDRLVGVNIKDWLFTIGQQTNIDYIVTDLQGKATTGTKVDIVVERQETKAAKVKGAGNVYSTEFVNQWIPTSNCQDTSTQAPGVCKFTPKKAGYYRVVAKIKDTKGNEHSTKIEKYASGDDYILWNEGNDHSLEIIPERLDYKVGDKARYLVKNPYPGAQALITIERYGVLEHFVQTFEDSMPVIEFEIKPDYIPGFYLSAIVFSPRVDKPIKEDVDLGKPTYRAGYLTVPLKDPYKEIKISSHTDREVYKPRERVKLSLHAEPRFQDKKEPIEIAVAVLDESVFDLLTDKKAYFDPYEGFYKLDSLDLRNYSLLTRLAGRQKFEKKGANPGGDGGASIAMRNAFKFISYWNPSIKTDENGDANVEFEVPDNLTGWRVIAMAVTPSDRMGLGFSSFKANLSTEVRPVMPNRVIEGDSFEAGFSIMNRLDKERNLTVIIEARGDLDEKQNSSTLTKNIVVKPYERLIVKMPIKTKRLNTKADIVNGHINFFVTAKDNIDGDSIKHELIVGTRSTFETAANYSSTVEGEASDLIKLPEKIYPDKGDISVNLSPSLINGIDGAFQYLKQYPYSCWEQRLSKALMASNYAKASAYIAKDFKWADAEKLPYETLEMASNFQAPNGGMTYFTPMDQYVDPYLSSYTAMAFNIFKKNGYKVPEKVEEKLHKYLENFLKQDIGLSFYNENLIFTVRAVALAVLAENNKITIADLERYRSHVSQMSVFGKICFMKAAMKVAGHDKYIDEVYKMILSSTDESSGKLAFKEEEDVYKHILSTPLRTSCALLSVLTELSEDRNYIELIGDIPSKLTRTIIQARGEAGWQNTQENVFCTIGLMDYAHAYEKIKPDMFVSVKLDNNTSESRFTDFKDKPITFTKNIELSDIGKDIKVVFQRTGEGRLYYTTKIKFAPLDEELSVINSGIEIKRQYKVQRNGKWEILKSPFEIKTSELVQIDLFISLPTARNFVVVDDTVPGGLEPVNRDLATSSIVDLDANEVPSNLILYNASRWSFYHKELGHDSVRFYSDYLPAGNYYLSYMAQAIAPGEFVVMPAIAKEMYNPDIYGKSALEQLKIQSSIP